MITITIKTDNAAFSDGDRGAEVARILRELATRYENDNPPERLRDVNGNQVGTVKDPRR